MQDEGPKNQNSNKRLVSIAYFVLFLLILFLVGDIFGGRKSRELLRNFGDRVRQFVVGEFGKNLDVEEKVEKRLGSIEIVKEESQIVKVVEQVSPAVVSIVVKTIDFDFFTGPVLDESGIGTGFIVDKKGIIVTNSHVVDDEKAEYAVVLKDGTSYEVKKIHRDNQNDLAILEIDYKGSNLPSVVLGDSDELKVGQVAIAIGNALGKFQNTVTVGVVSGIGRSITAGSSFGFNQKTYENVIQTDAAINPGNSGGPLLNSAGQVIGVNVATSSGADNISFAIPINQLKPILENFNKYGKIIKPYLGVTYVMINKEIASLRRLPQGAFVSSVIRNSPADKAGVKRLDIITKVNGKELSVSYPLARAIFEQKVGDEILLTIDRDGKLIELKATLEEMPQDF